MKQLQTNNQQMPKTSREIKRDLKKHFDFAVAYGDAIEALKFYEKICGKLAKKPASHKKRCGCSTKSNSCEGVCEVGNHYLRKR